ncbi:hypothetical protein DFH07DRAFT_798267 [Mycena maculata]|uniref:Zn(2)-C6 fungal-type domain-containing protein n=1 Tax=Mycena maculata TaxID=230809 RepID=A0AAD7NVJ6_9AGAR|nr:hypothetical protein DFH07DRAFT_798267 [Mycena maculata]
MSTLRKRPMKPPACDNCKARRVLCHSQPNGAPCPRCVEKNTICITTSVPRGRPRKNPLPTPKEIQTDVVPLASSSSLVVLYPQLVSQQLHDNLNECPELTPELVAHLFECFDLLPPVIHPLIKVTSIKATIRAAAFQLHLLPPQSRVLALCAIALSSLLSFHEAVLGPGPRPHSFADEAFFSSKSEVRSCGLRRSAVFRALRAEAFKAAWDTGIMLQVSNENTLSCYLLDVLERIDSCAPSRPWATAYTSHVRALAPTWRAAAISEAFLAHWAGILMAEALRATQSRKPVLITRDDQLLLSGPEPPSLEALLASLEISAGKPNVNILFHTMQPYTFHITCLARQLWETITGDNVPQIERA